MHAQILFQSQRVSDRGCVIRSDIRVGLSPTVVIPTVIHNAYIIGADLCRRTEQPDHFDLCVCVCVDRHEEIVKIRVNRGRLGKEK